MTVGMLFACEQNLNNVFSICTQTKVKIASNHIINAQQTFKRLLIAVYIWQNALL